MRIEWRALLWALQVSTAAQLADNAAEAAAPLMVADNMRTALLAVDVVAAAVIVLVHADKVEQVRSIKALIGFMQREYIKSSQRSVQLRFIVRCGRS